MAEFQIGSIADWVSGIGSLSAAIVALYVAHTSQKVKLKGHCGHRLIVGGRESIAVFSVSATNISQRPTVITNIGVSFGIWRWTRFGVITMIKDQINHGSPLNLSDGETGNWCIELGHENVWLKDIAKDFKIDSWAVFTWRVHLHTSNGGTTILRPEKLMREILSASASKNT